MMTRVLVFLAILWLGLVHGVAQAHPMPESTVQVRVLPHSWQLSLKLPADRLEVAFVQAGLVPDPGPGNNSRPVLTAGMVGSYVQDRIAAQSADGTVWGRKVLAVRPPQGKVDEWLVDVELTPPANAMPTNAMPDAVLLDYEVIVREIATHSAVVTMTEDWSRGVLPHHPHLVGALRADTRIIRIDRQAGNSWQAWFSMVALGARHILEGVDHLAFLVTLILTAPLYAVGRRWRPLEDTRPVIANTVARVSAFTVGHSVSLLAASLGWLPSSGRIIEVLIAVSVGVSALHAIYPLFPKRESWIAGGFGLIHGMAFATTISAMSLGAGQVVAATLGFNLGIELVQLALVAVVLPIFVMWRHQTWEVWARRAISVAALGAAVVWVVMRVFSPS